VDRTLREHIEELEQTIQVLSAQLMDEQPQRLKARDELEAQLRAVESALRLYRSAFEVESYVVKAEKPLPETQSEPPGTLRD
jgi:hypothetical protein